MNEPLDERLIAALSAQTAALNRLAESNESLVSIIYETFIQDELDTPVQTYLNGRPRG